VAEQPGSRIYKQRCCCCSLCGCTIHESDKGTKAKMENRKNSDKKKTKEDRRNRGEVNTLDVADATATTHLGVHTLGLYRRKGRARGASFMKRQTHTHTKKKKRMYAYNHRGEKLGGSRAATPAPVAFRNGPKKAAEEQRQLQQKARMQIALFSTAAFFVVIRGRDTSLLQLCFH
jgi:hypothetical protein